MPPRIDWTTETIMQRIHVAPSGCWEWTHCRSRGYGVVKGRGAHRVVYELFKGPVPPGLQIDHLCRNRACVNPEHLEPVTARVNQHRSYSIAGINARKTHCDHGHELSGNNVRRWRGKRICRACRRAEYERARSQPGFLEKCAARARRLRASRHTTTRRTQR